MGSSLSILEAKTLVFQLTGSYADIVRVDPMNQERAPKLRFTEAVNPDGAVALVVALDYMPLAITQAAAYYPEGAARNGIKLSKRSPQWQPR